MFVAAHVDNAMGVVNTWVYRFDGRIDGVAFLVASNHVVAHLQGNDLLVVEHVLDDDKCAELSFAQPLVGVFLLLPVMQL